MTEKTKILNPFSAIDPGSLMLAAYVFAVSALVLLGWLGSGGASDDAAVLLEQSAAAVVQHER